MPAKAGIQKYLKVLDSANGCALRLEKMHYVPRLRGNDAKDELRLFTKSSIISREKNIIKKKSPVNKRTLRGLISVWFYGVFGRSHA